MFAPNQDRLSVARAFAAVGDTVANFEIEYGLVLINDDACA